MIRAGKKGRFILIYLIIIFIFAFTAISDTSIAQSDEVHVFIHGPEKLAINTTTEYTIEITGGPGEEGGNWSFKARVEGEDNIPTTAKIVPEMGNSSENIFKLNLTTPEKEETIILFVNGSSYSNESNIIWSGDFLKKIDVFKPIPINITATIRNPTQINVEEAVISFYIRPKEQGSFRYLGNKTLNAPANSTTEVWMNWNASKDDEGENIVQVRINEAGAILEFTDGDNVMEITIYIGDRPDREMAPVMIFDSGLVFILDVMAFFFFLGAFWMRRQTIRGRGYYSTAATNSMYIVGIILIVLSIPVFYVSQIIAANPEELKNSSATGRFIEAIWIFILGFATLLFTWDRTRRKKR